MTIDEWLLCLSFLSIFSFKAFWLYLMHDEFVLVSRRNIGTERTHAVVNIGNKMLTSSSLVSARVDTIIEAGQQLVV